MFENPYARLLLLPFALGALLFGWLFLSWRCSAARNANAPRDEQGRILPDTGTAEGKLKLAERVEYEKPSESVRLTIEVADGTDAAAAAKARELLPRRLLIQFQYASRTRWQEAESSMREIEKRAPGSAEAAKMQEAWKRDSGYAAEAAARLGDLDAAGRLYAVALAQSGDDTDGWLIESFQSYSLALARKLEAAGNRARADEVLDAAAAWVLQPRGAGAWGLELAKRGGPALWEKARAAAAAGKPAQALTWFAAANAAFSREQKWEEARACEEDAPALALAAARGAREGKIRTIPLRARESFWREAAESKDPAVRVEALDGLTAWVVDAALAESNAADFDRADAHFHEALERTVPEWWVARAGAEKAFDPWAGVPAELLPEIDKGSGNSRDPAVRLQALLGLMHEGRWTPPHPAVATARAALPDFYARWGAELIRMRRFDRAESMVRGAIRADPKGKPAKACVAALEAGIRDGAARRDLEALVALTSFYVAELGAPSAVFATDFRNAINAAADGLKDSPMERIFMLSLICDVFPGTPEANAAREEILAKGIDFAKASPEQRDEPGLSLATGIKDVSAVSIDNATGYHIFIFYEGPERFFVRLNPYRKGTVAMRAGTYVVGVVAPEEKIRPYHASRKLEEKTYWDQYEIVQGGTPSHDLLSGTVASGEYTLLRGVPDLKLVVDPKSGVVLRGK